MGRAFGVKRTATAGPGRPPNALGPVEGLVEAFAHRAAAAGGDAAHQEARPEGSGLPRGQVREEVAEGDAGAAQQIGDAVAVVQDGGVAADDPGGDADFESTRGKGAYPEDAGAEFDVPGLIGPPVRGCVEYAGQVRRVRAQRRVQ